MSLSIPFRTILTLIGAAVLFGGMLFSPPPEFPSAVSAKAPSAQAGG